MIFKKVAGICRAAKAVFIDSGTGGVQFIGDGIGMYAISGLGMTPDRAKVCFDVPAEKEGGMDFCQQRQLCFRDSAGGGSGTAAD